MSRIQLKPLRKIIAKRDELSYITRYDNARLLLTENEIGTKEHYNFRSTR